MPNLTPDEIVVALRGDPEELDVHFQLVEQNVKIKNMNVNIHCHCLSVDANGQVNPRRLAEFLRNSVLDYAIPPAKIQEAKEQDDRRHTSSSTIALYEQAKNLFTDLKNSGEGGELILNILAQRFLGLPQVICKMSLKTSTSMHYHGADGVYASIRDDGVLQLYWGESKIHGDMARAVRECLSSLAPYLLEPQGETAQRERDLNLISDSADLSNPAVTDAFKKYFDKTSPLSNRVEYCAVALVGFDSDIYPTAGARAVADEMATQAKSQFARWRSQISNRINEEKIEAFKLEFLCIPLPSAQGFRGEFLNVLGFSNDT